MKRLMEYTVFLGLVTAWRRATKPTSRSPLFENATTDGVVRKPSALGITLGSPPSMTATQEFVVPRSIPMTLPMKIHPFGVARAKPRPTGRELGSREYLPLRGRPLNLNLDLADARLFRLRDMNLEHPVPIDGLDLVAPDRRAEHERPLEAALLALDAVQRTLLLPAFELPLAPNRQGVAGQGQLDVFLRHARQVRPEDEFLRGFLDVDPGSEAQGPRTVAVSE